MRGLTAIASGTAVILLTACGAGSDPDHGAGPDSEATAVDSAPAILKRPFTAEQIRDEWVEGFELEIRRWDGGSDVVERWRVVAADADGVDIESVAIGEDGQPTAEAATQRSSWIELRDHASFSADRATREAVARDTLLGELDGWLYTVDDPAGGTVTEFFFARDLPGAPVFVHVMRDGEIVGGFQQLERRRPGA
jgi:hypothetical protein